MARRLSGNVIKQTRSLRVLAIGNTFIDTVLTLPEVPVDEKVWIDSKAKFVGGQGANAAQDMSLLGLPVSLVTRLGDDGDGVMALRHFQEMGLCTAHCITVLGAQSLTATVVISTVAQTRVAFMHRDPALFVPTMRPRLDQIDLSAYDFVYTDGHQTDLALPIAKAAIAKRLPLMVDMEVLNEETRALADLATELIAPAEILEELAGVSDPGKAAMALADRPGKTAVATAGRLGSFGARQGLRRPVHVPAHPKCQAKDTVGAGDAYHAGYLVAIARGVVELEAQMAFATAVAAALCETSGPVVSLEALRRYELLPVAEA